MAASGASAALVRRLTGFAGLRSFAALVEGPGGGRRPARVVRRDAAAGAFELEACELASYARRLARRGREVGGDPRALSEAWEAVAFQCQGLADSISPNDAGSILCALSVSGVLQDHVGAHDSLVGVLRARGTGALKPRKVVSVWTALDRADLAEGKEAATFLRVELPRALPGAMPAGALPEEPPALEGEEVEVPETPKGDDRSWMLAHALLAGSGCSEGELRAVWTAVEEATLADAGAVRGLSVRGLVAAMRAAALASERAGVEPSGDLAQRLCERAATQAKWMDGWAASHAALAAAALGAAPGAAYDPLRTTLLERCALQPEPGLSFVTPVHRPSPSRAASASGRAAPRGRGSRAPAAQEPAAPGGRGLGEAERVAAALARFDVHDAEVRDKLSEWLMRPLPDQRFAQLASSLAGAGLGDATAPKVARHIRGRARSAELTAALGAEAARTLLNAYARAEAA